MDATPPAVEYDSGMTDTRSRLATAAVAAVLVLLLGSAALLPVLLDDDSAPTPSATPTAPGREEPAAAPEAVPTPLTAAPTGVTWELFEGVALPTSRTDGPTRTDGPVHAGYSRTPTGALLADAQITYRSLVDPDLASLRQVAQVQLVDGPGKTAYLNLLGQLEENEPPATGYAQIVGFRFITFTPDLAVISLATRGNSGAIQVSTDTLRWVDGDWKLDLPASGLQQPQVVQDLSGYVPWSGVS
jgi:hypothetical protein